ncbi:serine/threonine-protein phosphatase 6 regulatory ankyrin repeat subunit B-like [Quercus lobata]|uniref:serine/threonine-protein phosphatase 6 regulatory ankyrin repeat subunit B-like n=1 Tax=Quercus lobata TaxID=97700 RepID=UPI001244342B|nr:serine/threonine-protein phosphatase 6 regulatory ankyrin repeat subunit B-like [Quercus lobata]
MLRETALHVAIAHGSEDIVEELLKIIHANKKEFENALKYKNDQGNTPLHVAASTGSLRTCICIAEAEPSMGNELNKEGKSPLFLAALLGRTEIFFHLHSICESHLGTSYYRKEDGETILHCAIKREYWDLAYRILLLHGELAICVDENGILPIHLLAEKPSAFRSGCHLGWWSKIVYYWTPVDVPKKIDTSLKRREHKFPENYQTCFSFIQLLWRWTIIPVGKVCDKGKKADEENPERSNVTLKLRHEGEPQVDKETPILSAAKNGIIEMVERILRRFPMAIHDETSEGKNIVMLAAEYRQTQVYELFCKRHLRIESMFHKLDNRGNSALHLAAKQIELKTGLIPGAALQMQWEIKWYEHIMKSMPRGFLHLPNKDGKTPGDVFMDTHKLLVEEGGKWLSDTSNACSIVAGLFVTVAFNMSTTVPGELDEKGNPRLEKQLAFNIFAISSYISFYSSLLAMIMFLAILTSGNKESSFRSTLPMKLLFALTAFYVSIASTAICFSAAHFFILRQNLKSAAFPAYSWAVLLLICFAISGFPLYFHLTWAIFKRVPHHHQMITPAGFHIKH